MEKFLITGEWPLPRIHLFPTAGLEKKNYQPVCVLNLEKQGLAEGGFRGTTEIGGAPLPTFISENCWPVMLAGRIGLQAAAEFLSLSVPDRAVTISR